MTLYHEPPSLQPLPEFQVRPDSRGSWPPSSHSRILHSRYDRATPPAQQYPTRSVSLTSQGYGSNSFPRPPPRVSTIDYAHNERNPQQRPGPRLLTSQQNLTYDPSMYGQVNSHQQPDYQHYDSRYEGRDIAAYVSTNEEVKPQQPFYEKQDSYRQEPFRYIGNMSRHSPPPDTIPRQQHTHDHGIYRNRQPSQYGNEATYHDQRGPTSQRRGDYGYDDGDPPSGDETKRGAPENQRIHDPRPPPYDFDGYGSQVSEDGEARHEQDQSYVVDANEFDDQSRRNLVYTPRPQHPVGTLQREKQFFHATRQRYDNSPPGTFNPDVYERGPIQSGYRPNSVLVPPPLSGYQYDDTPRHDNGGHLHQPRLPYRQNGPIAPSPSIASDQSRYTDQSHRRSRSPDRSLRFTRTPQRRYQSPASSVGDRSGRSSHAPDGSIASVAEGNFKPKSITIIYINGVPQGDGWNSRQYSGPPLDLSRKEMINAFGQRGTTRGSEMLGGIPDLMSVVEGLFGHESGIQRARSVGAVGIIRG